MTIDTHPVEASARITRPHWGRRWLDALREARVLAPSAEGRALARQGATQAVQFGPGRLTVRVCDDGGARFEVRLQAEIFDHLQWRRVTAALRQRPLFAARLLANEVPPEIDGVFDEMGLSLLWARDVDASCSCAAPSCAHLWAACQAASDQIGADASALLVLRGRTREQLRDALRPNDAPTLDPVETLPVDVEAFYGEALPVTPAVDFRPPHVHGAVLARLGSPLPGCDETQLRQALAPAYAWIAAQVGRVISTGRS